MSKTINIAPTWEGVARMHIMLIENGTPEGQQEARDGIIEMGKLLDQLVGREFPMRMTDRIYSLLEIACKQTGTYEPGECLGPIEEQLTGDEYITLSHFLTWCHEEGKAFGHGNYEDRWAEWRKVAA